jgi:hypothetical protein
VKLVAHEFEMKLEIIAGMRHCCMVDLLILAMLLKIVLE